MLLKQGWKEGGGLGKDGSGTAKHVTVAKRHDAAGIGAEGDATGNGSFTSAIVDFNSLLSALSQYHGAADNGSGAEAGKASKKSKKSKKEKKEKKSKKEKKEKKEKKKSKKSKKEKKLLTPQDAAPPRLGAASRLV